MITTRSLVFFSVFLLAFTSCSKEQGCTDTQAENYSNAAEEDDGSCAYSGKAFVYYSYAASGHFEDDGILNLSIYMDNEFVGIMGADESVAIISNCNNSLNVTKTFSMGSSKMATHLLSVEDQDTGQILYTTEFQVQGGLCLPVEIDY